jgi:hypothetical protein
VSAQIASEIKMKEIEMFYKWKHCIRISCSALAIPALSFAFHYFPVHNPPANLSATGLYGNMANKATLDTAAKAFEVNAALWSDDAAKKRWIILPKGKKIQWVDSTDLFDYPDSTIFVKTFFQVMGPLPTDTVYWETRLLVFKKTTAENIQNWWGYSYRWNAAQNEAKLVDTTLGFDTAFTYVDFQGKSTYKKWKFPTSMACNECHRGMTGVAGEGGQAVVGRGILGFIPMQLKHPITLASGVTTDQVLQLFDKGVFTGTRPSPTTLARRFIGMKEPISISLSDAQRWAVLDQKARAYLAVNCSGCHGERSQTLGTGARIPPNFDFHDLKHHDLAFDSIGSGTLNDPSPHTDTLSPPEGYAKLKWMVKASGLDKNTSWNMALPPGDPKQLTGAVLYVNHASPGLEGYPALSNGLFRQMVRKSPSYDSATWHIDLRVASASTVPAFVSRANGILPWLFAAPWGSKAWIDTLKNHNFTLDSIMAGFYQDYNSFNKDHDQMPPLATYLPDTTAMKVFGEWVTGFGRQGVSIRARTQFRAAYKVPVIQNRVLFLPDGWRGKVQLLDIRGRATALQSAGSNRYVLPANLKPGLLIFKIGNKQFKAYLF